MVAKTAMEELSMTSATGRKHESREEFEGSWIAPGEFHSQLILVTHYSAFSPNPIFGYLLSLAF
jgi:hypothetical protein